VNFCRCKALKKTGHGINGAGIQEVLPMAHKATDVPRQFELFWHGVLPKQPNRPTPDGPEFGQRMVKGPFRPVGMAAGLVKGFPQKGRQADNRCVLKADILSMALTSRRKRFKRRPRRFGKDDDGIHSVRCRICRNRLRVISGRHLSKHDVDRQTYMDEYGLSPDELIAKDFRVIQSSRRDYFPHGRKDWIKAIKAAYKRDRNLTTKGLQLTCPDLYHQGVWIFGSWNKALRAAGFEPERVRRQRRRDTETLFQEIRGLRARNLPLYANYAMRNHAGVFKKGLRQYGSWNATLVAAGVLTKPLRATLSRGPRPARPSRARLRHRNPGFAKNTSGVLFREPAKGERCVKKGSRLEQGKDPESHLPFAPQSSRVHDSSAACAGARQRRPEIFRQLGQSRRSRRHRPEFVFCASHLEESSITFQSKFETLRRGFTSYRLVLLPNRLSFWLTTWLWLPG
jgi:hypothetical protein